MTWNDLKEKIEEMTPEQKETDVTFFDDNEGVYGQVGNLYFIEEGAVDQKPGTPFLCGLD